MRFKTFISEQTRKPEHTHAVTRGKDVVSYHTSSKSAHKKADSLDNKYGATVHSVKLLESEIYEMIPYALSAANANAEHARQRKPKEYTARLPDAGRKPESRSEYTANREMTKENYAIAAKIPQTFKIFRGGIKGKGSGTRRTHTNKVADHVKIFKESSND